MRAGSSAAMPRTRAPWPWRSRRSRRASPSSRAAKCSYYVLPTGSMQERSGSLSKRDTRGRMHSRPRWERGGVRCLHRPRVCATVRSRGHGAAYDRRWASGQEGSTRTHHAFLSGPPVHRIHNCLAPVADRGLPWACKLWGAEMGAEGVGEECVGGEGGRDTDAPEVRRTSGGFADGRIASESSL